jgi:predicted MFS family arabinose efflux permease
MADAQLAPAQQQDEPRRDPQETDLRLSAAQWLVLLILAAVQFTHVLDFMIVMPLGPQYMRYLGIDAQQFGLVVAAYGFSAGLASLLAAWFIDRFDRKASLLVLYGGLTTATLLCAMAPNYPLLALARAVAGAFGGVVAACVLTIVGDVFPGPRRGTANGVVMSAFSVASIVGVPAGLWLASQFNWRAPFAALTALGCLVLPLARLVLPPLRGHQAQHRPEPSATVWEILLQPTHLRAFALSTALVVSSFLVVPYLATYLVKNAGRTEEELPFVYLFGGAATLLSTPLAGWLTDRIGKLPVFRTVAVLTVVPLLAVTNLPPVSLAVALTATTLLMVITSARWVPAMALITASAVPRYRGSFLSLNASFQQMAMGLASLVGGAILDTGEGDTLTGFPVAGALASLAAVVSTIMAGQLRTAVGGEDATVHLHPTTARTQQLSAPLDGHHSGN